MKVVLLGNYSVGKSSICHRIVKGHYIDNSESTIGAGYYSLNFKYYNVTEIEYSIKMDIWDTSGQEKYRSISHLYYHNANIIILVFDLTDQNSFNDIKYWVSEIKRNMTEIDDKNIYIVGNKRDAIEFTFYDKSVEEMYPNFKYFKVSAKTNEGIIELISDIKNNLKETYEINMTLGLDNSSTLLLPYKNKSRSKKCCSII